METVDFFFFSFFFFYVSRHSLSLHFTVCGYTVNTSSTGNLFYWMNQPLLSRCIEAIILPHWNPIVLGAICSGLNKISAEGWS